MRVVAGAGRDRFAAWDREEHGERVATGDWLVTDAERAAAGRETVTGRFPVRTGPWLAAGFSNGAAWAIAAGQRRPDVFGGIAALSAGVVPHRVARGSRQVRHHLAAGTLEPGFRRRTSEWAARLDRAGTPCIHREWAGGHDSLWWQAQLPAALAWLLAPG